MLIFLLHTSPQAARWSRLGRWLQGTRLSKAQLPSIQAVFLICMIKTNPLAPLPHSRKKEDKEGQQFPLVEVAYITFASISPARIQSDGHSWLPGRWEKISSGQVAMNQTKTKRWTTRSLCHSRERIVYEIAYITVKGKRQKRIQWTQGGTCYALYQIPYLHYFI